MAAKHEDPPPLRSRKAEYLAFDAYLEHFAPFRRDNVARVATPDHIERIFGDLRALKDPLLSAFLGWNTPDADCGGIWYMRLQDPACVRIVDSRIARNLEYADDSIDNVATLVAALLRLLPRSSEPLQSDHARYMALLQAAMRIGHISLVDAVAGVHGCLPGRARMRWDDLACAIDDDLFENIRRLRFDDATAMHMLRAHRDLLPDPAYERDLNDRGTVSSRLVRAAANRISAATLRAYNDAGLICVGELPARAFRLRLARAYADDVASVVFYTREIRRVAHADVLPIKYAELCRYILLKDGAVSMLRAFFEASGGHYFRGGTLRAIRWHCKSGCRDDMSAEFERLNLVATTAAVRNGDDVDAFHAAEMQDTRFVLGRSTVGAMPD